MAAAANIQEAIDKVVESLVFPGAVIQMNAWVEKMFTPAGFASVAVGSAKFWDAKNVNERTVYNWAVPTIRDQRIINEVGNSVGTTNIMIEVVLRTLLAVQAAKNANRISQDQEDTVVAAYNVSF